MWIFLPQIVSYYAKVLQQANLLCFSLMVVCPFSLLPTNVLLSIPIPHSFPSGYSTTSQAAYVLLTETSIIATRARRSAKETSMIYRFIENVIITMTFALNTRNAG